MLLEQLKKTVKRYGLIKKKDRIVVGVSGGPDSVALLYLLNSLQKELRLGLHIAHLDHMLRADSDKDAAYVRALAEKLDIPATFGRVDVKVLAKKGSEEEVARNARLDFLFQVAARVKADSIALGHNLDDQAETVLMRVLRGAGLYGLRAISPKRNIRGRQVIRPLIETRRSQIEAFLKKKKIKPRRDASNSKDIYFRNKIRNDLLPYLEKGYSRNIKAILANMAESVGSDYDYLLQASLRAWGKKQARIGLKKLSRLHPAIKRIIFREIISKLKGDTRRIGFRHIKEIEDLILNRPLNSVVDLPGSISVTKGKNTLSFRSVFP
ncbi:MAG: tRNA lysidine(34) synthetase TilS [Candidatus Pacebacteria bacterium]|nr:tRNA lysidine(34) synthetase TilS [Candidatus Paceibacterota bacterium]